MKLTIEDVYNLVVEEGKISFEFSEDENGTPRIAFSSDDPEFLSVTLEETNLSEIAEKIIILASLAGLKEPTLFYKTIEDYVKDENLNQKS